MKTKLEDLRKWFGKGKKGDWVRVGTDGEIKGDCAREPGEGKPKCMPRSKAHSMDKKDRASSARRKRRADPSVDRPGTGNKPIMVKTDKKESVDMNENKIFFVKVGDGRDSMTVKTKAPNSREALKKIRSQHPKDRVSLDQNQKQGKPAGALESVNLEEALVKVTDVQFDYRDQLPNSPKTSDIGAIKYEWKMDSRALRDAVKKMGGLVTDTVAPSSGNKWVGTVTIGTRNDPSKLDNKSIQKAVKSHGIEIHSHQFRESVNIEEKNVPTNPALWAKMKAQAKAKFDVYPSAYANGWAAKKYKAAGGGWKTESVKEMKSFFDIRESLDLTENYRTLARAGMGTESKGEARVGLELDYYDGAGSKRMGKITKVTPKGYIVKDDKDGKSRQFTFHDRAKAKEILARIGKGKYNESVEEAVGDTALAYQTPYGTVTATKRNTKGMRGKQDGYSLSLKTKSGKTVDLGSHPKPTKATVMSIAKNVMS